MTVDAEWVRRNLGIAEPSPTRLTSWAGPLANPTVNQAVLRKIIDFDSDGPSGVAFSAAGPATGVSGILALRAHSVASRTRAGHRATPDW